MSLLPIAFGLVVLFVAGLIATARAIARDGYGTSEPPRSHEPDQFEASIERR